MTLDKLHLLYVEDNEADYRLLEARLRKSEFSAHISLAHCTTLGDAAQMLNQNTFQAVLLDLSLPDAHGLEGVRFLQRKFPSIPIVVLTGNIDTTTAMEAIQQGAQDYLIKGAFANDLLYRTLHYAIERKKINLQLSQALNDVEQLNENLKAVNNQLRKTVEELKEEKKLVLKKNKQINDFFSVLMHDLRNPVAAINALTELLLGNAEGFTIPQVKFLNQIKHSSSSMLDNILTIIGTTKMKEGSLALSMVHENPYYTINSAIDKYIIEAIQHNIILVIGYRKELPKVYFDKRLLVSVVSGLLDFGIRNSNENTRLMVHCELLEKQLIKVSFENRGLYLTDEQRCQVFQDDFTKAPGAESLEEPGTAIQLSSVKKFVEIMDGEIGVEPGPQGKGTIFWFTLQTVMRTKNLIQVERD
jgi:signal transduction histidine kinase